MLEKMRNEFEIEREGYAAAERDLRSRLTSETERNATLNEQHKTLQKKLTGLESEAEALRTQNSSLANVYETAKRLSEELARGAGDLATTLTKTPVDDGAPEAQGAAAEDEDAQHEPGGDEDPSAEDGSAEDHSAATSSSSRANA
jgi:chromosome segregation ATPase